MKTNLFGNILSGTLILMSSQIQAGHGTGNSADNISAWQGVNWFSGSKPVDYCIQVEKNFGVTQSKSFESFEQALSLWKNYLEKRVVDSANSHKFRQTLNFQYRGDCRKYGERSELKVYLGVENAKINEIKKRFINPSAFVYQQEFNKKSGRSTGFIWVAPNASVYPEQNFPNWKFPENLKALFLHEVGHILGIPHIKGTIMDPEELRRTLIEVDTSRKGRIDHDIELLTCEGCLYRSIELDPKIERYRKYYENALIPVFKKLVGRDPSGMIRVDFQSFQKGLKGKSFLKIYDDLGITKIALETLKGRSRKQFPKQTSIKIYSGAHSLYQVTPNSRIDFRRIISANNRPLILMIERNHRAPVMLSLILSEQSHSSLIHFATAIQVPISP